MAYLKKRYREMLEKMNKELKLPKGWNYFVNKEANKDGLLIKSKGICTCTNCKTKFKTNKKVNEYDRCPKCKNEYLIKRSNYKWHEFEQKPIILLDKIEENWIIRLFMISSYYTNGRIFHSKAVEYGRVVLAENINFVNNRVYNGGYGNEKVNVYQKITSWRLYHNGCQNVSTLGKLFHNNLKDLFKDTEYRYSQLWTLAKKEDNIAVKYFLENNFPSTEILIKMGLYKLALCPKTFNKKGSFEERFGVSKTYYKFMKENNIDINELDILKLYKKQNIKNIKYLSRFSISDLKEIMKYMTLDKFISYANYNIHFDIHLYKDYLEFLKKLKLDYKDKIYLFPDNLKLEHDKLEKQIEIQKNKKIYKNIKNRYKELEKNTYLNNKYIIFPAKSMTALEDESKQQKNCIRTYSERYSKGICDIYFMRDVKNQKKSLVTVEVYKNKIAQCRTKFNKDINKSQENFLKKWEKQVLSAA